MTTIPTLSRKCLVRFANTLNYKIRSRPADISDTRERLATHYAVQDGEANEPDHTEQTGNRNAIVSIFIYSAPGSPS